MLEKLKEHPAIGKLIAQYDQLPKRDQQALMVLVVAVILGILYFGIWRPAASFHDQAESAQENAVDLLAWMRANRDSIQTLSSNQGDSGQTSQIQDSRALMSTVTRSAGEAGLSLNRFEPSGERAIRVWLEDVPFQKVAAWLEKLHDEFGVVVDQASFDREDTPGMVSVRLTLEV